VDAAASICVYMLHVLPGQVANNIVHQPCPFNTVDLIWSEYSNCRESVLDSSGLLYVSIELKHVMAGKPALLLQMTHRFSCSVYKPVRQSGLDGGCMACSTAASCIQDSDCLMYMMGRDVHM
jgi:hypothetical protein